MKGFVNWLNSAVLVFIALSPLYGEAADLTLTEPEHRDDVGRYLTLRGECEIGRQVAFYAKSPQGTQTGEFDCDQSPFIRNIVLTHSGPTNFYLVQYDATGDKHTQYVWLRVRESNEAEPQDLSSGGSIAINGIRTSRSRCVSPCTVMFSLDRLTDSVVQTPFTDSGIYWDYDDDGADQRLGRFANGADFARSGRIEGAGASRERDTNTPIGMHTYICASGTCEFRPGVAVRNRLGDWATAWTRVTVQSADTAFSGTDTVCISGDGDFGGDRACPSGAQQQETLPGPGEWRSHTRYLLRRGESFSASCLSYGLRNIQLSHFGNSADSLPEIERLGLGHAGRCNDAVPTDSEVDSYHNGWLEEVTVSGVRVSQIDIGMSFRHIDLHGLDMDFGDEHSGGQIRMVSADACSRRADLSCDRVPLPFGFYLSESVIRGSTTSPPGLNIGFMPNACVSFVGLLGVEIETAFEHNVRLECASRVLAIHSDLNGNHIGDRGNKAALTVRSEGYLDRDMLEHEYKLDSSLDKAELFDNRYLVAKDLYLGTPDSINNAARISFTATRRDVAETSRSGLVSGNLADLIGGSGSGPATFDSALQGVGLVCYDDNDWSAGGQGCGDYAQGAIPDGFFEASRTSVPAPVLPLPPEDY